MKVTKRKLQLISSSLIVLLLFLTGCQGTESGSNPWAQVEKIKSHIKAPAFPDRDCNIKDYGAVGDGETKDTEAIKLAIQDCYEQGGGRVVVPEGTYLTGAVQLLSNINLHIEEGATLLFSHDLEDYLPMVFTRFEGMEYLNYSPFVYAYDQKNIALTGSGTIDGNADGDHWWPWAHIYEDRDRLLEMNANKVPPRDRKFGPGHKMRPNFVQFYKSKNILISGIKLVRSPMWNVHPVLCENVIVDNIRIESLGPNNDGVNPESSKNVWIKNSYFNTGDDCIAIKSGRNQDGRRIGVPSENIIIENNEMKEGHGGVVMGSEISGGVRNVFAQHLKMDSPNLERVLRIKTSSRRGGVVENVYMRDVEVGKFKEAAIKVNMRYGKPGNFMPTIRNIQVEDLTVHSGGEYGIWIDAYPESPVTNLQVKNTTIDSVKTPLSITNAKEVSFSNVKINGKDVAYDGTSAGTK